MGNNNNHEEVVEGLKPNDGLKVLTINYCGSTTFPKWMDTLSGMTELGLFGCKNLEKLPTLWQLPALQILCLDRLDSLHCLCSNGKTAVTFVELKVLTLSNLPKFEAWWEWDTDEVQGEEPIFPKVEELEILDCGSLTALPKAAPVIIQSSVGVDTNSCRSAFPALRKMKLRNLDTFHKWEAVKGTIGKEVSFPCLEELSIRFCRSLSALPKGQLLDKHSFGGVDTNNCCSAFPALKKMELRNLDTFHKWEAVEGTVGEEVTFPCLEELSVQCCRSLRTLPKGQSLVKQSFGGVDTKNCHSAFPALRKMELSNLDTFHKWDTVEGTVREELTFPCLEELSIESCKSVSELPKGPLLVKQSFGEAETLCSSAFPALRKLRLCNLPALVKLVAVEGTQGEEVTFPLLEELSMKSCGRLRALSKGPLVKVKQSFGEAETVCRQSAFPSLRKLDLHGLSALGRWGEVEGTPGEEVTSFPLLEVLTIHDCPMLADLPEAPKLSVLAITEGGRGQQISLETAARCISSLSSLRLTLSPDESETTLLHAKQKWNHELPLADMDLTGRCDLLFSSQPSALALWTCFAQLVDLSISECDALVHWPENVFQVLASLRKLLISKCSKLTGCPQPSDEQSAAAQKQGGLLQRLESLQLNGCTSLVEVPDLPASLKMLCVEDCTNLESMVCRYPLHPGGYKAGEWRRQPCLESLTIRFCNGLSEVANLPPSIKTLDISFCSSLQSLSGQLDAVQKLSIEACSRLESLGSCLRELRSVKDLGLWRCQGLVSLPDGPQAYSSLRLLAIKHCDGIKLLPRSLQSRLDCLERKDLDARHEEPETWTRATRRLVNKAATKLFPCSRDQEEESIDSD